MARYLKVRGYDEWKVGGGIEPSDTKRFAVISGEIPLKERLKIQDIVSSKDNKRGGIVAFLLVTKTGAEGLDLKNVRATLQLEPYWDKARDDQLKYRAVRLGSHDDLPEGDRDVQPYLFISTANSAVQEAMLEDQREVQTIDQIFHERALARYELILDFRRLLKSVSLECAVLRYGNCHVCVPTGEALFHQDCAMDLRLADPCLPYAESDIEATPVTVTGRDGAPTTYYVVDTDSPLGYTFYERAASDETSFTPVDPSDPIVGKLLEAIQG